MSVIQIVKSLPEEAKRSVLFRLVGSLNASVIYACQAHIRETKRNARNLGSNEAAGIEALKEKYNHTIDDFNDQMNLEDRKHNMLGESDPDNCNPLIGPDSVVMQRPMEKAAQLHQLREFFFDELLGLMSDLSKAPTYRSAMNFMLDRPEREFTKEEIEAVTVAFKGRVTAETLQRITAVDTARSRGELRASYEELCILTDSLSDGISDDEEAEDAFGDLPEATRENLIEKVRQGLNAACSNIVMLMLRKSGKANLGDIPLIDDALVKLDKLEAA